MTLKIPAHKLGTWIHPKYGKLSMDQQKMNEMKRNFADEAIGRKVFIRVGHDTASSPTFGGAAAEAIVNELVQEGDVLWALAEPTTPEAAELIKKYRYSSPEYQDNYKSKLDGSSKGAALEAIALTNEPFLPGLPECIALADSPDGFYLDFKEVNSMEKMDELLSEQKQTNGLLRKLADFLSGKKPEDKPNPTPTPAPAATVDPETAKKLADMQAQLDAANMATHAAEVNRRLSEYVNAGIPPANVELYRPVLLADFKQEKTIKLSDDKGERMISLSEQVYGILDNFPKEARVNLSQMGHQHTPPADDWGERVKLCDQDMTAIGFKVENGKYIKL